MTYAQIGRQLGITPQTAATICKRALRKIERRPHSLAVLLAVVEAQRKAAKEAQCSEYLKAS